MASSTMITVGPQFNMQAFLNQLSSMYQSRGFTVTTIPHGTNASIKFDKNTGGINMLLGLGQGVTANCVLNNNVLTINYTDEDWTGKIVGLVVGWVLCFVPFITAIIGVTKQLQLTKNISNDAAMIAANSSMRVDVNMGYAAAPASVAPTQTPAPQPTPVVNQARVIVDEASWSCQCGANGNTGAFCGQCGSARP